MTPRRIAAGLRAAGFLGLLLACSIRHYQHRSEGIVDFSQFYMGGLIARYGELESLYTTA